MTKINREEYEVLKELDDKWKWIARDEDGEVFMYECEPYRIETLWDIDDSRHDHDPLREDNLFQFIQWDDEEPYPIQELIEEYENNRVDEMLKRMNVPTSVIEDVSEREETEVKKDIEWLKKEIHKELEDWHGVEGGIDGDGINEIMLLINQHEESEVKRLERKIKELDSYNDELVRDNNQFRNELGNQEVLSEEWIDKNHFETENWAEDLYKSDGESIDHTPHIKVIAVQDLQKQNLIMPKQELPVIPKFVAEHIKNRKGESLAQAYNIPTLTKVGKWLLEKKNCETFARAWLDGYMVAEEQKFYVKDKKGNTLLKKVTEGFGIVDRTGEVVNSSDVGEVSDLRLTEQEIKEYDPRYMTFAKPVEEME